MIALNFSALLAEAAGNQPLQAATIIVGTFILEDAATLLAAIQVASGVVSLPLALGALYAGIILGDLGLYGLGWLSAANRWAARLVPKHRQDLGREWVTTRIFPLVLVSRFIPGLRFPTYTTLGFLRAPLSKFAAAAIAATLVWTSGLFFVCLKLGLLMAHYLGVWRWAGLAVLIIVIVLVGHFAAKKIETNQQPKRIP